MTVDIKKIKGDRFTFMKALYEATGGNERLSTEGIEFGVKLGFTEEYMDIMIQYLEGERLIRLHTIDTKVISITHSGIREVEEMLEHPEQTTEHFISINISNIGTMNNSSLQQGTVQSIQVSNYSQAEVEKLRNLCNELTVEMSKLELETESRLQLDADLKSLVAQLNVKAPARTIIGEILRSIRNILEGAAGSVLASVLLKKYFHD